MLTMVVVGVRRTEWWSNLPSRTLSFCYTIWRFSGTIWVEDHWKNEAHIMSADLPCRASRGLPYVMRFSRWTYFIIEYQAFAVCHRWKKLWSNRASNRIGSFVLSQLFIPGTKHLLQQLCSQKWTTQDIRKVYLSGCWLSFCVAKVALGSISGIKLPRLVKGGSKST